VLGAVGVTVGAGAMLQMARDTLAAAAALDDMAESTGQRPTSCRSPRSHDALLETPLVLVREENASPTTAHGRHIDEERGKWNE
jgi:hypothetical protein